MNIAYLLCVFFSRKLKNFFFRNKRKKSARILPEVFQAPKVGYPKLIGLTWVPKVRVAHFWWKPPDTRARKEPCRPSGRKWARPKPEPLALRRKSGSSQRAKLAAAGVLGSGRRPGPASQPLFRESWPGRRPGIPAPCAFSPREARKKEREKKRERASGIRVFEENAKNA